MCFRTFRFLKYWESRLFHRRDRDSEFDGKLRKFSDQTLRTYVGVTYNHGS